MSFDECVKKAIELGRKHMDKDKISEHRTIPTTEEWILACMLYTKK